MDGERQSGYQKMYFDINSLSAAGAQAGNKINGAGEAFVKAVIKRNHLVLPIENVVLEIFPVKCSVLIEI